MAKELWKVVFTITITRAEKELSRIFAALSGPKSTLAIGDKRYTMAIRDDFTRVTWKTVLRRRMMQQIYSRSVTIVRSDGRGDVRDSFSKVLVESQIEQEFTNLDSLQ